MTSLVGQLSLSLAVLVAALAAVLAAGSVKLERNAMLRGARWMVLAFAGLLTVSSADLVVALLGNDFRIAYVAHYTERALPVGYKLAAFWAGQEGSLLLWAWVLAVMAAIFVIRRRGERGTEAAATTVTLAVVCGFFAALMLFAADPFATVTEKVPLDGHGLNPMLQDPAMIAHPPMLFLGYAGFTLPFAMMIGALVAGRKDNEWIARTRSWTLASWLFLSIGILLGAQWAYVELGWGGYWAWDPVENASLLPWLTATALLHSVMAQQHRGTLKMWNASLIAMTFVLCIFGTYLTRSGVIQSVHSFEKSLIGTFFLAFLLLSIVASVVVVASRRRLLRADHEVPTLFGREGMFLATNILLVGIMFVTLIGTIFPIISRAFASQEVTVGVNFYNKVVAPMGLVLVGMMAVGPLLTYNADAAARLARGLAVPALIAAAVVVEFWFNGQHNGWALICVAITTLVASIIAIDLGRSVVTRVKNGDNPFIAIVKLVNANHRRYGAQIVHVGMMMIVVGIAGSSLFEQKQTFEFTPGQAVDFAGGKLAFERLAEQRRVNYSTVEASLTFTDAAGKVSHFKPERRFYDKSEQPNSEVAIQSSLRRDLYLTLAGWEDGGKATAIQAIVNPLVSWIWIGGGALTLGALICLTPRFGVHHEHVVEISKRPAEKGNRVRDERRAAGPVAAGV